MTNEEAEIIGEVLTVASQQKLAREGVNIDNNVEQVIAKHRIRAAKGVLKYGVTTERTDLEELQWLEHLLEELMDSTIYVQRLITDKYKQIKQSGQGSDGAGIGV